MPRINDIPEDLLVIDKADEFVQWCQQWPVSRAVRRTLIALWTNASAGRLSPEQCEAALRGAL